MANGDFAIERGEVIGIAAGKEALSAGLQVVEIAKRGDSPAASFAGGGQGGQQDG